MKNSAKLLAVLFVGLLSACQTTQVATRSDEEKTWIIGTGHSRGTYFPVGRMIAAAISNPPGSDPCKKGEDCGVPGFVATAKATKASVFNVSSIQNGRMDGGLADAQVVYEAYNGLRRFRGVKYDKIRLIGSLYPQDLHLVLPKGARLDSIQDLKGKRVGIAQRGSGTQSVVLAFLEAAGITRDDIHEAETGDSQSARRIADGELDAYFYTAATPRAAMTRLATTKGMELYSFSGMERKLITKVAPFFLPSIIPAGTYRGVDHDVTTSGVNSQFVTGIYQPEDLVYRITKALWNENTRRLMDNGHAKGKFITLDTALSGILIPLHPGAEKFYREQGLIK